MFEEWLKLMKFDLGGQASTINKATGHIGYYCDSFLQFMSAKNPNFRLQDLIDLESDNFVEISDPINWVLGSQSERSDKIENPSRKIEKYKANARLVDLNESSWKTLNQLSWKL